MHKIIQYAKGVIPSIVTLSNERKENSILVIRPTANGFKLERLEVLTSFIDEMGEVTNTDNCLVFGSYPLKPKQVKTIIEDDDYIKFLKT